MSCKLSGYSIGRGDILYVRDSTAEEFSQFKQPDDEPTSQDSFAHISASMNMQQERQATEEKNNTRSTLSTIELRKDGSFEVETYVMPRAANVKPDIDRLLAVIFSEAVGHAAGVGASGTISSVSAGADGMSTDVTLGVGEGANFSVDEAVGIVYPDGKIRAHIVTAVNTDTLTVKPKIPFGHHANIVGNSVYAGFTYRPAPDVTGCLVMEFLRQNEGYIFSGVVPGKATFSGSGTDAVRVKFEGFAADMPVYMGTTKQVIDHSDVDTALQITKGDADKFVVGSLISWYDISAGTYSTEKMRVTSIDTSNEGYDILNVTRNADGGGAFDPAIDDLIVPYHPGTDHQGLPISGAKTLEAGVTFTHTALTPVSAAGDDFIYRVKSWEVAYDNTIVPVNEEYGVDHATGYNAGRNASTVTLEAFMHRDLFREYGRARNFKSVGVMIQIGNVQGKCVALWMPRVDFDAQPIEDAANDDIVPTTFTGRMLGTNGADEMFLLFV